MVEMTRRDTLGLVAGAAASAHVTPLTAQSGLASLGAVGAQVGVLFGSAFDREIFQDAPYRTLIARECRIGTTENSLKFGWLRPRGPTADFAIADEIVAYAERNRIALRGTALVWNDWNPTWINRHSPSELGALLDRHIDETVTRYRGRLHSWDVVNEPFFPPHRRAGGFRKGPWFDALGKDHIFRAFRRAAKADPTVKLTLNEGFCEQEDELGKSVRPLLLRLIDEMQHAGVPLHAVGFQAHLKPQLPFDDAAFQAYLNEVARRGVEIYITELDVDDSGLPDDVAERDRRVAQRHHDFLKAVLAVPQVKAVIAWHLSDKYSWYRTVDWFRQEVRRHGGDPMRSARTHIYDDQLVRKPAWTAVESALAGRRA